MQRRLFSEISRIHILPTPQKQPRQFHSMRRRAQMESRVASVKPMRDAAFSRIENSQPSRSKRARGDELSFVLSAARQSRVSREQPRHLLAVVGQDGFEQVLPFSFLSRFLSHEGIFSEHRPCVKVIPSRNDGSANPVRRAVRNSPNWRDALCRVRFANAVTTERDPPTRSASIF